MKTLPLKDVRVLDLSRVLAGPLCTMMLGDLGANVIKVERPGTGDDTRGWGPPFAADGQSAYFLSSNRNKLSIAADFRNPEDRDLVLSLIRGADVVIDNFLPGSLARYGLDRASELAANERLIWCSISGFGADSQRPGYDFVVQAESGWMSINGPEAGPPMRTGVALVDVITGKDAAIAILAALAGRELGHPIEREIEISLLGSATAALINVGQNTLVSGLEAKRWGNAHPNLVPYQLFDAADRPFVIAVGSDTQWIAAANALGLSELAADPALATNAGRLAHRQRLVDAITARVLGADASVWLAALDAAGVPCGVVRSVGEALQNVQASPVTGISSPVNGVVRYPPPSLSAHKKEIQEKQWRAFDDVPILPQQVL